MREQVISPVALWKTFNANAEPLEPNIIFQRTTEDFIEKHLFISGITQGEDSVRVALRVFYPIDKELCPTVLYVSGFSKRTPMEFFITLVKQGYAVVSFDYLGMQMGELPASKMSAAFQYATFPKCLESIHKATPNVEVTPWYVWSRLGRRVVSYIQSDSRLNDKIMVVGEGPGTVIAWHISTISSPVSCLATLGGYYPESIAALEGRSPLTPDNERWVAGLLPKSYAQFITCPVLTLLATNSTTANFDMLHRIAFNMEDEVPSYSAFTPISEHAHSHFSQQTLLKFARTYLDKDGDMPYSPELKLSNAEEGKVVTVVLSKRPKRIVACYSHRMSEPNTRSWTHELVKTKVTDNVYSCLIKTARLSDRLMVFANVYYDDYVLSTPVVTTTLPPATQDFGFNRILYETRGGTASFTTECDNLFEDKGALDVVEGAMGIYGITATDGELISFKINDPRFTPQGDSILRIDVFTEVKKTIRITLYRLENGVIVPYYADRTVLPSLAWHKLTLTRDDFKTDSFMSLAGWADLVKIKISHAENMLFNNMLWL